MWLPDEPCEYLLDFASGITCNATPTVLVTFPHERGYRLCPEHNRVASRCRADVAVPPQPSSPLPSKKDE